MPPNPTERNVDPLLFQTGIRTVNSKHELASLSGQDLPFHVKSADVPKLTDTMSFAFPHSPNSGSLSLCHPTREVFPRQRFRFAAAHQGFVGGGRWPSRVEKAAASIALQFVARQLCPAHTSMNKNTKKVGVPTTLCGMARPLLTRHPDQPYPRPLIFPNNVHPIHLSTRSK